MKVKRLRARLGTLARGKLQSVAALAAGCAHAVTEGLLPSGRLVRLMGYAGSYRWLTVASWVLSGLSSALGLVPFLYIWKIVEELLAVAPDYAAAGNVVENGWLAVLFAALSLVIYIVALLCAHLAAFRTASTMRSMAMHHIAELPSGTVAAIGSGKLRKMVSESAAATETWLAHILPDKAGAMAGIVCLLILMIVVDFVLGLVSLIPLIGGFFVLRRMTGSGMEEQIRHYQNALDAMSAEAVEYIRGIPVIRTFNQSLSSLERFRNSIEEYGRWVTDFTIGCRKSWIAYMTAINSVFAFLILAGIVLFDGTAVQPAAGMTGAESTTVMNIIFYTIVTPFMILSLNRIMHMSEEAALVDDALARLDTVMAIRPMPFVEESTPCAGSDIVLDNVSFGYTPGHLAVRNISLTIRQGETVALTGPSGGGKSTLAALIARCLDPQQGSISIGGTDIRSLSRKDLSDTVSFLFQDSRLIKGTILDNVRLARPEADREEVRQALLRACCGDILDKFADGMDTVLGSEGVHLSGGEQQRIAIARIFLKKSPVIILDEATAFADPDNEHLMQKAFLELARGRTVIFIAHRLSTIVNVDRILVLRHGEIAEQGDFASLTAQGGLFARMWSMYQQTASWKGGNVRQTPDVHEDAGTKARTGAGMNAGKKAGKNGRGKDGRGKDGRPDAGNAAGNSTDSPVSPVSPDGGRA